MDIREPWDDEQTAQAEQLEIHRQAHQVAMYHKVLVDQDMDPRDALEITLAWMNHVYVKDDDLT